MFNKQVNLWKDSDAFVKKAGVWVPVEASVKENGNWIKDKKNRDPRNNAALVLETTNSGIVRYLAITVPANSPYPIDCYYYGPQGQDLGMSTIPATTTAAVDSFFYLHIGLCTVAFVSRAPDNILSGNVSAAIFAVNSNSVLTRITKIDNDLYRRPYPALRSDQLVDVPANLPPQCLSIKDAFMNCPFMNSANVVNWDTRNVVDFSRAFNNAARFAQNLSAWNTAAATSWTNFATDSGMTTAQIPPKFR